VTGQEDMKSPEFAEWSERMQQYQLAGVKTGDRMSLMALSNRYENDQPPDMAKSLVYWVAQAELSKTPSVANDNIIARLSHALAPDQAAAAVAEGKRIARAARPVEGDQQ
jgi:hypothetical protein